MYKVVPDMPTPNPHPYMHTCFSAHFSLKLICAITCSPARFRGLLYPLCVVAGLCYGSTFALVLALAADLFGSEHIATNYGLLDLGESVSTGSVVVLYRYMRKASARRCAVSSLRVCFYFVAVLCS